MRLNPDSQLTTLSQLDKISPEARFLILSRENSFNILSDYSESYLLSSSFNILMIFINYLSAYVTILRQIEVKDIISFNS